MESISRILVPVDFSACSRAALEYATFLAARLGAAIDVLHVWEPPTFFSADVMIAEGDRERTLAEFVRTHAGKRMEELLASIERRGVRVRGRLATGSPVDTIITSASQGYDVIVMGTHGHTGLRHLIAGNVTEKIVRRAPIPVLAVRGDEHGEEQVAP
jgi:universal stress protein A